MGLSQSRILIVGDSITRGERSSSGKGFRQLLLTYLQDYGYPACFVGSFGSDPVKAHFRVGAQTPSFYSGPGGYGGDLDVAVALDEYRPNIVIIHLGTNDVDIDLPMAPFYTGTPSNLEAGTITGRIAYLLAYIARWSDGSEDACVRRILVSKIIPKPGNSEKIDALNGEIVRIVGFANANQISRIAPGLLELVDQHTSFNVAQMMSYDMTHPNDNGYAHMAEIFYNAMMSLPMSIELYSNEDIEGIFGLELKLSPQIKVVDHYGNAENGVPVSFKILNGDATLLQQGPIYTHTDGIAAVPIKLGGVGSVTIEARCGMLKDSVTTFSIRSLPGRSIAGIMEYGNSGIPIRDIVLHWRQQDLDASVSSVDGLFEYAGFTFMEQITLLPRQLPPGSADEIHSYDAALAARAAMGLDELNAESSYYADVDRDGQVSLRDAALIARCAVGYNASVSDFSSQWLCFPDSLVLSASYDDITDLHWTARIMGDVDKSWGGSTVSKISTTVSVDVDFRDDENIVILSISNGDVAFLAMDGIITCPTAARCFVKSSNRTHNGQVLIRKIEPGRWQFGVYALDSLKDNGLELTLILDDDGEEVQLDMDELCVDGHTMASWNYRETLAMPDRWSIGPNYPNPFNSQTVIPFFIPERSQVSLKIYDILGRELRLYRYKSMSRGEHVVYWDGCDSDGEMLPSGTYFGVLQSNDIRRFLKMQLLQ
ncbi:T9SS type A sorting domain-containing protein [bacterium]|nr:T9SS type A sorting domain-containing protein [bacterium]